ncbi:MAG: L,D-transpeptidase family protein [Planctomycetes bacterium]|nr:L,D-transpeptidase family protein [Planctomycetota bacterium]
MILLALVGGLAWYGWTHFGTVEGAGNPAEETAEVHQMIPVAPRPTEPGSGDATKVPGPGADREDRQTPPAVKPVVAPPPVVDSSTSAPVERPAGGQGRDAGAAGMQLDLGARRGELVEQGRMMLHDLQGIQALLDADSGIDEERRRLLYALASVVIGQNEAAAKALEQLTDARQVTSEELAFLRSAVGPTSRPQPAAASLHGNPLLLGTRLGVLQREADQARFAAQFRTAAEGYSQLLREELRAPWAPDQDSLASWAAHLDEAQAQHRWSRRGDWPSFEVTVQPGDSLTVIRKRIIAERPDLLICTGLIQAVNQVSGYLQPDQVLRIPTDPVRVEAYIGARWVLYLHGDEVVAAWRCAVGREGHETPPGKYRVGAKQENPAWMRPGFDPVPFGHPDNPLGTRWITWDGRPSYGFHGTKAPETIGTGASDGCIRLRNEDVERLFEILPQGAEIDVLP